MPSALNIWLDKLLLIASDTYRDTIEGFRLLYKASVGVIKLLFLGFVFGSAFIFSFLVYLFVSLYHLYR